MAISFPSGFEIGDGTPVDVRIVVGPNEEYANLAGIPAAVVYEGLVVYDTTIPGLRVYTGANRTNNASDWQAIGGSGPTPTGGVVPFREQDIPTGRGNYFLQLEDRGEVQNLTRTFSPLSDNTMPVPSGQWAIRARSAENVVIELADFRGSDEIIGQPIHIRANNVQIGGVIFDVNDATSGTGQRIPAFLTITFPNETSGLGGELRLEITYNIVGTGGSTLEVSVNVPIGGSYASVLDRVLNDLNGATAGVITWDRDDLVITGTLVDTTTGNTIEGRALSPVPFNDAPQFVSTAGSDTQTNATAQWTFPAGPSTEAGDIDFSVTLDRPGTGTDVTLSESIPFVAGVTGSDIAATVLADLQRQWSGVSPNIVWTRTGAGGRTILGTSQDEGAGYKIAVSITRWNYVTADGATDTPQVTTVEGGPLQNNITVQYEVGDNISELLLNAGASTEFLIGAVSLEPGWLLDQGNDDTFVGLRDVNVDDLVNDQGDFLQIENGSVHNLSVRQTQ